MDRLGQWIDERCIVTPAAKVQAKFAYQDYRKWADERGEHALTLTTFGNQLTERGIQKRKAGPCGTSGSAFATLATVATLYRFFLPRDRVRQKNPEKARNPRKPSQTTFATPTTTPPTPIGGPAMASDSRAGAWAKKRTDDRRLGRAWQKLRARWLQDRPLCVHCEAKGRVTKATTLDHIRPRSQGGTEDETNLQGLCDRCHNIKSLADRGHKPRPRIGPDGWPIEDK